MPRYEEIKIKQNPKIRAVVASYLNSNKKIIDSLFCCLYSLLSQTYNNFEIFIHHDGPINDNLLANKIKNLSEKITLIDDLPRREAWGHYHRRPTAMIEPHADWILFTNQDNYYTPDFFKVMISSGVMNDSGLVLCDMIHSHHDWMPFRTTPEICGVDMGAFITRMDLVKSTPWNCFSPEADGVYAKEISKKTKVHKVNQFLFVHN